MGPDVTADTGNLGSRFVLEQSGSVAVVVVVARTFLLQLESVLGFLTPNARTNSASVSAP